MRFEGASAVITDVVSRNPDRRASRQQAVEAQLAKGRKLTIKIANMLREEAEKGALPKDFIKRVFEPGFFPSKIKPVKFSGQFLSEFSDEGRSSEEIEATVAEALRAYLSK